MKTKLHQMNPDRYLFSLTKRQADIIEWSLKVHAEYDWPDSSKHARELALKEFQRKRDQFKNKHKPGRKSK